MLTSATYASSVRATLPHAILEVLAAAAPYREAVSPASLGANSPSLGTNSLGERREGRSGRNCRNTNSPKSVQRGKGPMEGVWCIKVC
jgi:hypothetical protein